MANEQDEQTITVDGARIFLQPIAAPSILGLYGFAGSTFIVAANMAHWYGDALTALTLLPFAAFFGGLAQFLAGMWSYKARDGLATAMHGTWGSFWMAYGLLGLMWVFGRIPDPYGSQGFGFWFIALAAITWAGVAASRVTNLALELVLSFLAAGATAAAIGILSAVDAVTILAGWLFIISACIAWYTATGLMLNDAYGREVLPLAKKEPAREKPPIRTGTGEPGVMRGQ